MSIAVNKYQTELTDELLNSLNPEIKDQLLDIITSVPFVKSLISPDRKRARDLPRDSKGRIIVDLANPHIIEDMDYFRESAIYFKKYGVYTHLRPNSNPNSEFMKFMKREINRCWYGMVRESDGEWIPGYLYFYLNYSIIKQTKVRKGTKQGDRVEDFPECWEGNYFMFHYIEQARNGGIYNDFLGGQHCVEIAKRAAGKSFSVAAMCNRNMLLGENEITNKGIVSVVTAQEKESLIKDGTLNKFVANLDHCSNHTQFPRQRLRDSINDMEWVMGYKDADTGVSRGSKNTVQGVSTNNDPDKARGKRANLYVYEEFGRFKQFINTWQVNFQSVQEGDIAFGQALAIGTGGTEGSDFSGALEIIYNPIGYNVYALPNVFDRNSQGKQKTVFFFGAYLNRKGCYNEDGVSDVIAALLQLLEHRYKTKYNSNDATMLSRVKAENPITIQEAIMKRDSTIYPVGELIDRISELDSDPTSLNDVYVGKLQIKGNQVDYMPDIDAKSIREFPHKDNKIMGAVEIFMMPERDSSGYVQQGRYIAGLDPFDDDTSDTLSLGSVFVLDLFTDQVVAEYTGRPMFADDFYEICRRLLIMYSAECNYENNKKGLYKYFSQHNCLYLLSDTLTYLKDKEANPKLSYGNKIKGTVASAPIKAYARTAIRNWLLKPYLSKGVNANGEEYENSNYLLTTIKSRALLKELSLWNPDGNFDRHDALGMLMLLREDKLRLFGTESPQERLTAGSGSGLEKDDFFTKNYDNKY